MTDNNRPGESAWWRPDEPTQPLPPTEQIPPSWPQNQPPYPQQYPQQYPPQYPPGYGSPPPGYGGPPPGYGGPPPGYGGPPPGFGGPGAPKPPRKPRKSWVYGGIAAGLVALVGGGAVLATTVEDTDKEAGETLATTSASSGSDSSSSEPLPTTTDTFTDGLTTGSPTPTPTERRRTLRDVDQGLLIYDDVYVKPAKGWTKDYKSRYGILLGANGKGIFTVVVETVGYEAKTVVPDFAKAIAKGNKVYGLQMSTVRKVKPANSNISSQAQVSFTGRIKYSGATYSVSARCTSMTGVESIHNVTVSSCAMARKDIASVSFRDAAKMTASLARSI